MSISELVEIKKGLMKRIKDLQKLESDTKIKLNKCVYPFNVDNYMKLFYNKVTSCEILENGCLNQIEFIEKIILHLEMELGELNQSLFYYNKIATDSDIIEIENIKNGIPKKESDIKSFKDNLSNCYKEYEISKNNTVESKINLENELSKLPMLKLREKNELEIYNPIKLKLKKISEDINNIKIEIEKINNQILIISKNHNDFTP